ncbi:acyl-n-acyltransferase [Nannochloropsis oceanica]
MLGPSFLRRELSANILFLYLLRTSAAVVTPPERPAWTRGYVAFHKDRTGMKVSTASATAAAAGGVHDQGHYFTRPSMFGRTGGGGVPNPSKNNGGSGGSSSGNSASTGGGSSAIMTAASSKTASFAGTTTLQVAPPQVCIRTARRDDIPAIEACNLKTLPENYPNAFYHNHLLQWPYLALVAERQPPPASRETDYNPSLAPISASSSSSASVSVSMPLGGAAAASGAFPGRKTGHVSSLAVLDDYRRMGIAKELMEILHVQMKFRYGVDCSTLHVRCSNRGAQKLYLGSLGYSVVETVQRYYQDGANAYYMKLDFTGGDTRRDGERRAGGKVVGRGEVVLQEGLGLREEEEEDDEVREREEEETEVQGAAGGEGKDGGGKMRIGGSAPGASSGSSNSCSSSSSSSGFKVREKESALLTQDSQGYFQLYPSSPTSSSSTLSSGARKRGAPGGGGQRQQW